MFGTTTGWEFQWSWLSREKKKDFSWCNSILQHSDWLRRNKNNRRCLGCLKNHNTTVTQQNILFKYSQIRAGIPSEAKDTGGTNKRATGQNTPNQRTILLLLPPPTRWIHISSDTETPTLRSLTELMQLWAKDTHLRICKLQTVN